MSLLVLGASGRLGQMLRWAWRDRTDFNVTWHIGRGVASAGPSEVAGDLLSPSDVLLSALNSARTILNLSGITPAPGADLSRNVALGIAPFIHTTEARVLTASSGAVYAPSDAAHDEDEDLAPVAAYGRAKMEMENAVTEAAGGRAHMFLRIGNVAGADQLLGGLGRVTPRLHVFEDGNSPRRSYIGPLGLANAIAALTQTTLPDTPAINIAAGSVEMAELLAAVGRRYAPEPAPAGLTPNVTLSTAKLHRLCPDLNLAETPQAMVAEWTAFRESR